MNSAGRIATAVGPYSKHIAVCTYFTSRHISFDLMVATYLRDGAYRVHKRPDNQRSFDSKGLRIVPQTERKTRGQFQSCNRENTSTKRLKSPTTKCCSASGRDSDSSNHLGCIATEPPSHRQSPRRPWKSISQGKSNLYKIPFISTQTIKGNGSDQPTQRKPGPDYA